MVQRNLCHLRIPLEKKKPFQWLIIGRQIKAHDGLNKSKITTGHVIYQFFQIAVDVLLLGLQDEDLLLLPLAVLHQLGLPLLLPLGQTLALHLLPKKPAQEPSLELERNRTVKAAGATSCYECVKIFFFFGGGEGETNGHQTQFEKFTALASAMFQ